MNDMTSTRRGPARVLGALALELCLSTYALSVEGIEEAIELGRQSMQLINTLQVEDGEDDE